MGVVKVTLNSSPLIDITDTTAAAADVASGKYFYNVAGNKTAGTSSGGGGSPEAKQINFIDYDGSIVQSYTKTEWQSVSTLPSNPSHTGLTAQGWNWTKAQIDAQLTALPDGDVWVGQMYITTSGDTEIDITLDDANFLTPYLAVAPNGTITVNWGDSSPTETLTGNSLSYLKYLSHTYSAVGNYTIKLTVDSGTLGFYANGSTYAAILTVTDAQDNHRNIWTYSSTIKAIRIGTGVSVRACAFACLTSCIYITIPNTATVSGNNKFYNCYKLKSITIPSSAEWGSSDFYNNYLLENVSTPSGATSVPNSIYTNCRSLTSVTIPYTVTSIGSSAFNACASIKSLSIPSGVTSIDIGAFAGCFALQSITIPSGVTEIKSTTFANCYSLLSITIPSAATTLGDSAFSGCYSIKSITIPNTVTSIGINTLYNCYSLETVNVPNNMSSVTNYMFGGCQSLRNIIIPNTVTSIGNYAFYMCYSLSSIIIPNTVTSIGNNAFYQCRSLLSITVPSSVTSIGNNAFSSTNCSEYHFQRSTPPTLGTTAFSSIASYAKIYVPSASLSDYQTAQNWSNYASYMVGE